MMRTTLSPHVLFAVSCLLTTAFVPARASDAETTALAERFRAIARRAGGTTGISVIHVQSGERIAVRGDDALPLYSVFKLPVAVVVLKEVEAGTLRLTTQVSVTASDISPGWSGNSRRWRDVPIIMTVRQLLEHSLVDSDNTASDKLLALVGGPAIVTARMHALGFAIEVRGSTKDSAQLPEHPNRASATAIAALLSALQRGEVLQAQQRDVLWEFMARSRTGLRRLRGRLPHGTPVVDKTGTHATGAATNDVGVITLPEGAGHIAIAVLISGSKLPLSRQEEVIATIARLAYDAYAARPGQ